MNLNNAFRKHGVTFAIAIKGTPETVRARRFEVVADSGRIMSYWGPDRDPHIPDSTPKGMLLVFMDPRGVRRAQIGEGIGGYSPELLLYGSDGPIEAGPADPYTQPHLSLGLGLFERPYLLMRERANGRVRIFLGAEHGDAPTPREDEWGLSFQTGFGTYKDASAWIGTQLSPSGQYRAFVAVTDLGSRAVLGPR